MGPNRRQAALRSGSPGGHGTINTRVAFFACPQVSAVAAWSTLRAAVTPDPRMTPPGVALAPQWCHYGAMDLTPYVDTLHRELAVAAEAGGEEARELAERLTAPLESATRLTLLNVLSAAMDEITRELAPGSVDVRLRGLEPDFVVTPPPTDTGLPAEPTSPVEPATAPASTPADGDEGGTARVNLRLPAHLKARAEEAAAGEGLSVNAWLVRAVSAAVDGGARPRATERTQTIGQSYTGWVR